MCQKEDYLLRAILEHGAMMMSVAECHKLTMSMIGDLGQNGVRFQHTTQNGRNLRLRNCLFLKFPILYFCYLDILLIHFIYPFISGWTFQLFLCVLSCFSHVRLFATLWAAAWQALLSLGFSRQESWSGLLCPSPGDLQDPGIEPESLASPALAGGQLFLPFGYCE